jgi:exodeoxyribonuclease V beta subunit
MVNSFNVSTVTLSDLNLIEASAGTGKTFTLAEIYCRLILEQDLTVEQILVVTFTRAATEELRSRLREKLVNTRNELIEEADERSLLARQKLNLAIQSFDEAAIFTMHGFCQRVLGDFAFESGLAFDLEVIRDDHALLQAAVDDFWRRHITTADHKLVQYLLAKKQSPEALLKSIRSLLGKPYLHYLPIRDVDIEKEHQQAKIQFEKLKMLWNIEQDIIRATLQDRTLLNGVKYGTSPVQDGLESIDDLLSCDDVPLKLFHGFERFTFTKLQDALKKDQQLPELAFWEASEQLQELVEHVQAAQALQYQHLRYDLLIELLTTLKKEKQQQRVQSNDDLLLNLERVLEGSGGDWLVARLRQQYPAALIDEFQDTDPVQYASFSRIYADSSLPVFLVGDPKQAIYSFRGADIFTYLSAKKSTQHEHTLGTNWRSHPDLVNAVNTILNNKAKPFIYEGIPFHPVKASRERKTILTTLNSNSALQFLWIDSSKEMGKIEMAQLAAKGVADEIALLLNQADSCEAILLDKKAEKPIPVSGGDIAILVRNHNQAHIVQQCLQMRGINSVQQGRDNVFSSKEALMLERVLFAISEPQNQRLIIVALSTELWGLDASELYELQQDEQEWSVQLDLFYDLHQLWVKHGFMRAFRHLMNKISGQQQLLKLTGGERKLTNLLHLSELIQTQCSRQKYGMEKVLRWITSRRKSIDPNDESGQLRLESDEQLVKIITIHKSKGLEYPIVFCPFLWDSKKGPVNQEVISFHDRDDDYRAHVAFSEPSLSEARKSIAIEESAEDLRLLYVALTRARERCVITWGHVKAAKGSALFSLLHPELDKLDRGEMLAQVRSLAAGSKGTISLDIIEKKEPVIYKGVKSNKRKFAAKKFKRFIHQPWRIGSFSALTGGHDAELPDYDSPGSNETVVSIDANNEAAMDRFTFPRGAHAGTCLHAIFEHWDFASEDHDAMQALVSRILLQYGFDELWTRAVCEWVREVLATSLNNTSGQSFFKLADLSQDQRLDELSFYFPVTSLTVNSLQKCLLPLLDVKSPLAQVISQLKFSSLSGFMKGFIDLVYEYQGCFYIVDYKSNWLGIGQVAYQQDVLDQAMISHDYPLQYLIYSLALHRYLRLRLSDYDPEVHLGGAYYLFIRGMKPNWDQSGIFFDRPSAQVLDALDLCLQGLTND